jgi:hypothetical protein
MKEITRRLLESANRGKRESTESRQRRAERIRALRRKGRDIVGAATGYYRNSRGKRTLGGR